MGTLIWLIFTTAIGYAIGYFFWPEYILWTTIGGFLVGLAIRFLGIADDVADIGFSLFD